MSTEGMPALGGREHTLSLFPADVSPPPITREKRRGDDAFLALVDRLSHCSLDAYPKEVVIEEEGTGTGTVRELTTARTWIIDLIDGKERTNEWMDGWMNGWMNGWMDEWMSN